MIRAEYLRFLQTLNTSDAPDDVRKIANLVLANLDDIIPLGTHQGQRIQCLVALTQANWATVTADIQSLPEQTAEKISPITHLSNLSVGPFRGFAKQEIFDLSSRLVLIYGPNGTGKSSFCEALEYSLLGNVIEAESKRFRDQREYLKNAYTKSFKEPELSGCSNQGEELQIIADEALYRFCFVEKNRIDSFSRIAAQAPARQTELISTLFGLDSFNNFVRNFTSAIENKYIDLAGAKAAELAEKRRALAGAQQQITSNIDELKNLDQEELATANQYNEGATFAQMVLALHGDGENPGAIQLLEKDLQQPIPTKSNVTLTTLQKLQQSISSNQADLNAKQKELMAASQQVSFKQLYEVVTKVQPSCPDCCPACKTPISQVEVNPYIHASDELQKLQHLAVLQQTVEKLDTEIKQSLIDLSQMVNTCVTSLTTDNKLSECRVSSTSFANIDWWNSLHQQQEDGIPPWQHLEAQVKQLEETDKTIDLLLVQRTTKQTELQRFRDFGKKITELQTRRKLTQDGIAKSQQVIRQFETENAKLIKEAESEKSVVVSNQAIANAYAAFVEKLNAYKNGLPEQLVADLGETVVALYNAFNRYDSANEKLTAVQLPLAQNQRLKISFHDDSEKFFDALYILSEGHIRCLGLAILMAKNLKENCPIVIFDDPVNAIDDEHRRAIRETFFIDDFFKGKQIILAIHGYEFFNGIHQLIGKEAAKGSESYLFSAKDAQNHIQVNSLTRPKNYVLASREFFNTGEFRDSLMSARRGLENLCDKAWNHYGKHSDKSDDPISVCRRSPNLPWDLRSLAENLKARFKKSKADIPNKDEIIEAFTKLLGENAQNPPWSYLNKGTHDEIDLPEFDRQTVDEIVNALEQLDKALLVLK